MELKGCGVFSPFSFFFPFSLWQAPLIFGETEAHGCTSLSSTLN